MLTTEEQLLSEYWGFNPKEIIISKQLRSFFRDSEIIYVKNNENNYILKVTPIKLEHLVIKNQLISKIAQSSGTPVIVCINNFVIKNNYIYELYPMMVPMEIENINFAKTNITDIFKGLQNINTDVPELLIRDFSIKNESYFNYLNENLYKYIPYMETSFIHGDLHPHNIFTNDNQLYLSDWETAGIGPKLYDLAFFCGCLGLHGEDYLKSENIIYLLHALSTELYLDPLSIDTFHSLLIYTRIRWLLVWEANKDIEMIENENNYIDHLIDNHTYLTSFWKEHLTSNLTHSTKWIITDSNFSNEILELKSKDNLMDIPVDSLSEKIPQLIIAYGKENNFKKNIDLLELHKTIATTSEHINDLLISFINFSLDASRLKQKTALKYIIDFVEKTYPNNDNTPICLAYLYRNYFTLLTEINDKNIQNIKDKFLLILKKNQDKIELWEEYSRILTGEISFHLNNKNLSSANNLFSVLKEIAIQYPSSTKITSSYKLSEKNISK